MPSPSPDTRLDDALDRASWFRAIAVLMRRRGCLKWAAEADKCADIYMSAMKDEADA